MSLPSASAFQKARQRHQTALNAAFAGVIVVGALYIKAASITTGKVTAEISGVGEREIRTLNATFDKKLLLGEPRIGITVTHESREYILEAIEGRESWQTSWKLVCIEKTRKG